MCITPIDGVDVKNDFEYRIEWVDACKGFLIALMVVGHSSAPIGQWIYMFHMSAFMFISGYTTKPGKYPFGRFLFRRIQRILLPYVIWNLVFIAFYRFLSKEKLFVLFDEPFLITVPDFFRNLWTADLGGATWFLVVIFEIALIYESIYLFFHIIRMDDTVPYVAMAIGCLGYWLCKKGDYLPYYIDLSLYGLLYFSMGNLCRKKTFLENGIPAKPMSVICIAVSVVFGYLYPEVMMNWPTRSFVGLLENMISTVCGIYMCYRIAKWICQSERLKRVSEFYGKHTLLIVISHFAVFRLIFASFVVLKIEPVEYLRNLTPQGTYPMEWFVVSIGTLFICGVAAKLIDMVTMTMRSKIKVIERKKL